MTDPADYVAALSSADQIAVAYDLATIVEPYGLIDPSVIEPAAFGALAERLRVAATADVSSAGALAGDSLAVIDPFTDEPIGRGFYTFGALVTIYYASQALSGDIDGPTNTVKRFLDLMGAADDDGEVGLYKAAMEYVERRSHSRRGEVAARIATHAASLR